MYRMQDDVAQNAMTLLSLTNNWILIRHQWLIDQVRCILTGEVATPIEPLPRYDELNFLDLALPENLATLFMSTKTQLDALWQKTVKASHPASGLTVFEQISTFQAAAKTFIQFSKDANMLLWQELTMRDSLTGAWGRLTMNQSLNEVIHQFNTNRAPSVIALLDQNNFKAINDEWGHVIGDQVLSKTSQLIQSNLRASDQLFRYGGDEWLIIMPNTNLSLASALIKRIAHVIENHAFNGNNETTFHSSFCYGLAEVEDSISPEKWITDADYQLYAKKLSKKLSLVGAPDLPPQVSA